MGARGSNELEKISIVLPTHNRQVMLQEALSAIREASASVAPQNVIVVDDDSTDQSRLVVEAAGARYLRVKLGEPGRVRNAGLELVDTEYVMFLDDDDVVCPGHPDRLVEELEANPQAGFAFGQAQTVRPDLSQFGLPFPAEDTLVLEGYRNALLHRAQLGTVVFRTSAVREAGGFDTALRFFEDCDLQVRIALQHQSVFVPGMAILYRVHPQSVTGARSSGRFLADLRHVNRKWRRLGVPRGVLWSHKLDQRGRASFAACYAAERLAHEGDRRASFGALIDGLRLSAAHAIVGHRYAWKAASALIRPGDSASR